MLRSTSVQTIRELAAQGQSIQAIATETGIARNTVRKYLRGTPEAAPRPRRTSKLDQFRVQIRRWVLEDRLLNCPTILERLQQQGYTGRISILKDFVQPLRPPRPARRPSRRYETIPGEQLQIDWGKFVYEQDGQIRKLYGFTAVLSYSRMRLVVFTKRCDTPSLIRCLMLACEYLEGLPATILTDRMKSVLVSMDGSTPLWNGQFADFLTAIGVTARVSGLYAADQR
jgi:transposase